MGKGKGNVEYWVAVVKPGRIMFEVGGGIPAEVAKEALRKRPRPTASRGWLSTYLP